jgi:hypothetical protein
VLALSEGKQSRKSDRLAQRKPAVLATCGFSKFGAGIAADRQLRWMRPILLNALSHSENRMGRIVAQFYF